jgi:hypothetical protein
MRDGLDDGLSVSRRSEAPISARIENHNFRIDDITGQNLVLPVPKCCIRTVNEEGSRFWSPVKRRNLLTCTSLYGNIAVWRWIKKSIV